MDGAVILAKPVTKICNLSRKLGIFPDPYKPAKFREWTFPITDLFCY